MRTKVGIVGLGVMGARHARVFAALVDDFDVVGAFDPGNVTIQQNLRRFEDLSSLVDASDLVVVASPIESHVEAATLALDRGKHVFVEKPLARTATESNALVERAALSRRSLFVGHSERFHPVVRALKTELDGDVVRAMSFRRVATGAPRDASLRTPHADALLNLAVHDLDLAMFLGGGEGRLKAARVDGSLDIVDVASLSWKALIVAGRGDDAQRNLIVYTDRASYIGDLRAGTLHRVANGSSTTSIALGAEEPLLAQAAAVAKSLRGEVAAIATGEDGSRAVALAEEALLTLAPPLRTAENL